MSLLFYPNQLLSKISSFLTNNPLYQNTSIRNLFITFGAIYTLCKAISLTKSTLSLLKPAKNLPLSYGSGSWALVSGASEGIGKAFALELARQGFNIVLLSHNKDKLEAAQKDLLSHYPQTQTRIVVADLTRAHEEGFAEEIYQKVSDLDISILINNAAVFIIKPFLDISLEEVKKSVIMNDLSHSLIIRAFLPKMTNRSQRSAIINISSLSAVYTLPNQQIYGASKTFLDFLSRGLSYEHSNLDVISVKPGVVDTAMVKDVKKGWTTAQPEQVAEAVLGKLGNMNETFGYWKHGLQGYPMGYLSDFEKKLWAHIAIQPNL